ncbi:uncharacterized protein BROUX77_006730 [Berkeleyomyces rouxiae]|uniref:uncharacterized protein n=1 Tax=Berkeleyomyces rouxiae TaxID=2035830 RepID=UPI003B7D7A74
MAVAYADKADEPTRSPTPTNARHYSMTPSPRKHGVSHIQPTTPRYNMSPIRKRPAGISQAQKQALIDNLHLEITERARRLRAQYNLQAQSLRTRVEIRLNRIPMSLRKLTMAELAQRHVQQQERSAQIAAKIAAGLTKSSTEPVLRPGMKAVPSLGASAQATRRFKRTSNAMLGGGDKENDSANTVPIEYPKKRVRGATTTSSETGPVLSPTSSNSRLVPRSRHLSPIKASPIKVSVSRAVSPVKTSRPNILSNMVEKAKTTRAAMTRKATTASVQSTSSAGSTNTASTRTKRMAASKAAAAPATVTRVTRRTSGDSNSSSSTVVKKTTSRPGTAMSKSSTTSRGKAASTTTKKTTASKATAAKEAPKRVLRSRAA